MIEHLRAPDRRTYAVKSTRMIGDELWVQLDTTARVDMPMSRWFRAFDLAGLWQINHPAIDRLRGVKPPFESGMVYDQPQPDQRTTDNIIALTEILNTRNPERQKSRDLYTDKLYWEISQAVAA